MASSGPNYPAAGASLANAGTSENANAWTTPGNVGSSSAVALITAATYDSPDISELLVASNFGFAIPANATIDGITVEIRKRGYTSANSGVDNRVQLATGTTFADLVGTNKASASVWPQTTLAVTTYGGAADTWSAGLTAAQVNATGFAVFVSAKANVANADVEIDYIRVTIAYTPSANTDYTVGFYGSSGHDRDQAGASITPSGATPAKGTSRALAASLFATGGGGGYASLVLADSPAAYWRLGETSGTAADNAQGAAALDATYVNSPTLGAAGGLASDSNAAVGFNGTTQYADVADNAALDLGDTFSLEAWINGDSWASATSIRSIVGKGTNSFLLFVNPSGELTLSKRYVADIVKSTVTLSTATWYHVVATKSGSTVKLYIDGVDRTGTVTNSTIENNTSALGIGTEVGGSAVSPFDGRLDEVAIYGTALSSTQVADHYAAGQGPYVAAVKADSPYAYWRLGEASGTNANDEVGTNDGTYVNTPTLGASGAVAGDTAADFYDATVTKKVTLPAAVKSAVIAAGVGSLEAWFLCEPGQWLRDASPIGWSDGPNGFNIYTSWHAYSMGVDGTSASYTDPTGWPGGLDYGWHHIVGTYDGANIRLYIDGALAAGPTAHTGAPTAGVASMEIANYGAGSKFDGKVDEVAVYTTVLSASQVAAHYDAGVGQYAAAVLADSPVIVLPMSEASGNLTDIVAGKTATASGTPTYGAAGPIPGGAIDIPSGSDYFTVADHADIDLAGTDFSIEVWYARDTDSGSWQGILSKQNAWGVSIDPDDYFAFTVPGVTSPFKISSGYVYPADGSWHHYVITQKAGASVPADRTGYVDGVAATLSHYLYPTIVATATDLVIGNDTSANPAGGKIAFAAVYKSILTPAQVAAHYAAASPSSVGPAATLSAIKLLAQLLTAAVTFTGAVSRRTARSLAAGFTPAGSAVKRTARSLAGGLTPAGAVTKAPRRLLGGSLTPGGALGRLPRKLLTASLTPSGASPVRRVTRSLAAGLTPGGALAKRTARSLAGGLTFAGSVARQTGKALAGAFAPTVSFLAEKLAGANNYTQDLFASLTPSGSLVRSPRKALAASLAPAGALSKRTARALAGTFASSGVIATSKFIARAFSATLTFTGAATRRTSRALTGALTPSANLAKRTARSLAAGLTPAGVMTSTRVIVRLLTATLSTSGSLARRTGKSLGAALAPSAIIAKASARRLTATLTPGGVLGRARAYFRTLTASQGFLGGLARQSSRSLAADLAPAGGLAKLTARRLVAALGLTAWWAGNRPGRSRGNSSPRADGTSGSRARGSTLARSIGAAIARSRGSTNTRDS